MIITIALGVALGIFIIGNLDSLLALLGWLLNLTIVLAFLLILVIWFLH